MDKQFDGLFGNRVRGCAVASKTILRQSLWLMLLLLSWASTAQAASSITFTITSHEVSGNCTLYPDETITGTLTPTAQANVYTIVEPGGATITLTVPGSNTFTFSHPSGDGTLTSNMQLTFDALSHSIIGSSNWTETNGCMGSTTKSGFWTPASSTPTTAIVASGLWNVTRIDPACNYTDPGTFNVTYANGAYSATIYFSSHHMSPDCQNQGVDGGTINGFFASAQDLLTTSQFQAMFQAFRASAGDYGGLHTVTFSSPDSVSFTATFPDGSHANLQMTRASPIPTSYALAVTKSGTGSGTVASSPSGINCGTECSESFTGGTSVSLAATPAAGSFFAGWSGACTGRGSCSVTMDAARKVIAIFKLKPFAAAVSSLITATKATITASITFDTPNLGKQGAVFITSWAPARGLGAMGALTVPSNKAMSVTTTRDNPYTGGEVNTRQEALAAVLAAADPNAFVLVQLTSSGWQLVQDGQLIPYTTGVLGDALSSLSILNNTDPSNLLGAQFCVGYGTSAAEMIAAGRMMPVADIPGATATATGSCDVTAGIAAIEFYKADIDHYFMTASTDEATALDNKPEWNWVRTGKTFNIWLSQSAAPGNASPVCRFFGVFANGTVGSHFYTVDTDECAYVKSRLDWGWGYENDAFYAVKPVGSTCPSGTSPVYRTYNNGMGGAPNHRYMVSQTEVDTMVSQGWVSEGTAFCGVQ